jgi:hypothetical protein
MSRSKVRCLSMYSISQPWNSETRMDPFWSSCFYRWHYVSPTHSVLSSYLIQFSQTRQHKFNIIHVLWFRLAPYRPKDCKEIYDSGKTTTGVYTIYPWGDSDLPVDVYCDMVTSGGGWTVSFSPIFCELFF